MRNAGEGTPGGSTSRRQRVSTPAARPAGNGGASLFTPAYRVRHANAPDSPGSPSSPIDDGLGVYRWSELDQPSTAYRQADYVSGAANSAWSDDLPGGYSWPTSDQSATRPANAIRGFPPVPDEPLPTYPPGPFAAWNRGTPDRGDGRAVTGSPTRPNANEDSASVLATATITPDEFDTNHSLPAIKDPALTKDPAATRGGTTKSRAAAPARGQTRPSRGSARSSGKRGSGKSKRASRSSKRQPVRLAIGAAAVIIVAVAAILVISSIGKPGANSSANNKPGQPRTSTSPTPARPVGRWGYIGTRLTDPVPLALSELFPGNFIIGDVHYYLATSKQGHNCHKALIGTALQTAVRQAQCSQVLRASYMARVDKAMATIGVFNLATSASAGTAALHAGPAEFVAALPAKTGVTDRLGQGSGIEEAVVKGHYLVLAWAEYIDLSTPETARQRQHLTGFMNTLIQATINKSLSYRMVDGKPPPTA